MTLIPQRFEAAAALGPQLQSRRESPLVRVLAYACPHHQPKRPQAASFPGPTLVLAQRGSFQHHGARGSQVVGPGSLVVGQAGEAYACSHEGGGGDCGLLFQYEPSLLEGLSTKPHSGVLQAQPRWQALALTAQGPDALAADAAALALLEAATGQAQVPHQGKAQERRRAQAGLALLEARHHEAIGLKDLAAELGLSPWQAIRGFRQSLGTTPHQALMRIRLNQAQALLAQPELSVTEVALASGFGDLTNFLRCFKRHLGQSPGSHRRRLNACPSASR